MLDRLSHNPAMRPARHGDFVARFAALLQPIVNGTHRFARAVKGRRSAYRLAALDDHMLSDIGLTRFDVDSALSMPLDSDPNAELVRRRSERITNQRRTRKWQD